MSGTNLSVFVTVEGPAGAVPPITRDFVLPNVRAVNEFEDRARERGWRVTRTRLVGYASTVAQALRELDAAVIERDLEQRRVRR